MGSAEKKKRREVRQFLNRFSVRYGDRYFPLQDYEEARNMLIEFASPLEGLFDGLESRYSIAIFAWNLSLAPSEKRSELLDKFLAPIVRDSQEGRKAMEQLLESLVERRETLYPNETVLIVPRSNAESSQDEQE